MMTAENRLASGCMIDWLNFDAERRLFHSSKEPIIINEPSCAPKSVLGLHGGLSTMLIRSSFQVDLSPTLVLVDQQGGESNDESTAIRSCAASLSLLLQIVIEQSLINVPFFTKKCLYGNLILT